MPPLAARKSTFVPAVTVFVVSTVSTVATWPVAA